MRLWCLFTQLSLVVLTTAVLCLLTFLPLDVLARLDLLLLLAARLLDGYLSSLYLHTYVMCCIGCLYLSRYYTTSLLWSHAASLGYAQPYLCDLCHPVSDAAARWLLRSAIRGEVLVPCSHLAIMQRCAISVVEWLLLEMCSLQVVHLSKFCKSLSPFSLVVAGLYSASE